MCLRVCSSSTIKIHQAVTSSNYCCTWYTTAVSMISTISDRAPSKAAPTRHLVVGIATKTYYIARTYHTYSSRCGAGRCTAHDVVLGQDGGKTALLLVLLYTAAGRVPTRLVSVSLRHPGGNLGNTVPGTAVYRYDKRV